MIDQRQNISRTFSILNSLLIFVFILFFVDKLNLYLLRFNFIIVLLIIAPLRIYCMGAICGGILEIVSGEEYIFQIRRINQNAKKLWPVFLIVFGAMFLIDFLFLTPLPFLRISRTFYLGFLSAIASFVLARWTINKKYISTSGIPPRSIKFNPSFWTIIFLGFLVDLISTKVLGIIHIGFIQTGSIAIFISNYIHAFEFIFSSLFILSSYPEIMEKFGGQKEIFLINPMSARVLQSLEYWFLRGYPPAFVVLKALSPKTYKFREFNRVIWHDRYYKGNALVCVTCFTSNCYEAYKIAKEFKKRGSTVVMGGPHVTYMPDEALAFCDSVVIGSAEGVWRDVIRDYENGTLKSHYTKVATEEDYHEVHKELLNSPPHVLQEFLETIRGCKFKCRFCTVPAISGGQVRPQPVVDFIELIQKIRPHAKEVSFIDNNIYSDPGYAKELFAALKPMKIKWHSASSIDIAANQEVLKLARESGCEGLLIGYEISGSSLEKNQGGKFAMARKFLEYSKTIKKTGIKIKAHFIYGFDTDNLKSLFQLWKFCFSVMPRFTVLSMLTPLPGSGVYQDMLSQDRIISLNWRNYALKCLVVRHPHLNHRWMSFFFPLIQALFLMTTSSFGIIMLIICCTSPWWVDTLSF